MSVLIIGGSGFVGSNLCNVLNKKGIDFTILDLNSSPYFPDKTIIGDICEAKDFPDKSFEQIVHLAAVHRDDVKPLSEYHRVNVVGSKNVLAYMDTKGIKKIIFTSTVAVYGFAAPNSDEDTQTNPFNQYGQSKLDAEDLFRLWHENRPNERNVTIIRPTVIFGEGNRGNVYNLLNAIFKKRFLMIGDGKNHKSMAYVGNVANFLAQCLNMGPGLEVYNYVDKPDYEMNNLIKHIRKIMHDTPSVGPRIPLAAGYTIGAFADILANLTGKAFPVSKIRVQKFTAETTFSCDKLAAVGTYPKVPLAEALKKTVDVDFLNKPKSLTEN